MKNALKILCIILALCMLCSCSKVALDSLPDEPADDTEQTPPPSDTGSEDKPTDEIEQPDQSGDEPPSVIAFRTYTDYADIFSVINGNADISYGVYPEEAQQADGSATVVSANGLTEQKITLSPTASDGKYIYTVNRGTLFVCTEDGTEADAFLFADSFSVENGDGFSYGYENAEGVFLDGTELAVVSSMYEYDSTGSETNRVNIYFCDISDPSAPKVDRTLSQDGRFISASVCDGTLFAVSSHMITSASEQDITTYIPHIYTPDSSATAGKTPVAAEDIQVFEYSTCAGYTVAAGYDIASGTLASSAAALGGAGRLYTDETDIYMVFFSETSEITNTYTEDKYDVEEFTNRCMTAVLKFPKTADVSPAGEALIDGCFMGDFSIYSKGGTLYLCTIAERSVYGVYTDTTSGWSERRDISAEIENILYAMSDDLSSVNAYTLPNDVVFSARFAENCVWVGYFSEELCFDLGSGQASDIPAVPSCFVRYSDEQFLGINRKDEETLTFTMYSAEDLSVSVSTDLAIPTSFLNSTSVAVHQDSGIITLSAGAYGHCAVSFDGEAFTLAASVPASGWVHCAATENALFIIADSVTALDITDFSEINSFELSAQSGAVG